MTELKNLITSIAEWIEQKKESVRLKTDHLKLSSQKNKKKKEWKGMMKAYGM